MATKFSQLLLFCLATFVFGVGSASSLEVENAIVVADYSNIHSSMPDDPHQAGYAVTLYKRSDGLLFGDFTYATGTTEGVGGGLFDVRFKEQEISFKTKLSAYKTPNGTSRELFEFTGKVQGNYLIGTLTQWDGNDSKNPKSRHVIQLKKSNTARPISYEVHQKIFPKESW